MSTLTKIINPQHITYTHPTIFTLKSFNLTPTINNPILHITISPLQQDIYPQHNNFKLSIPSQLLSTQPFSTITTEHHTPNYYSPLPLTIFNSNTQLNTSQYNSIPINQPISITIIESLHNNQLQLTLTNIKLIH